MDTASGGSHVRMRTHGASQGVMFGEQVTATIADPSVEMNDGMPPLVASDSECDDDEDESESSDGQSDSSSNTEVIVAEQPLIAWCLLSDASCAGCTTMDVRRMILLTMMTGTNGTHQGACRGYS